MLFSSLPTDIIHHILSYIGTLKHRNGKYMGQISKTDKRYELLLKIQRKICYMPSISTITANYYYLLDTNIVGLKLSAARELLPDIIICPYEMDDVGCFHG